MTNEKLEYLAQIYLTLKSISPFKNLTFDVFIQLQQEEENGLLKMRKEVHNA